MTEQNPREGPWTRSYTDRQKGQTAPIRVEPRENLTGPDMNRGGSPSNAGAFGRGGGRGGRSTLGRGGGPIDPIDQTKATEALGGGRGRKGPNRWKGGGRGGKNDLGRGIGPLEPITQTKTTESYGKDEEETGDIEVDDATVKMTSSKKLAPVTQVNIDSGNEVLFLGTSETEVKEDSSAILDQIMSDTNTLDTPEIVEVVDEELRRRNWYQNKIWKDPMQLRIIQEGGDYIEADEAQRQLKDEFEKYTAEFLLDYWKLWEDSGVTTLGDLLEIARHHPKNIYHYIMHYVRKTSHSFPEPSTVLGITKEYISERGGRGFYNLIEVIEAVTQIKMFRTYLKVDMGARIFQNDGAPIAGISFGELWQYSESPVEGFKNYIQLYYTDSYEGVWRTIQKSEADDYTDAGYVSFVPDKTQNTGRNKGTTVLAPENRTTGKDEHRDQTASQVHTSESTKFNFIYSDAKLEGPEQKWMENLYFENPADEKTIMDAILQVKAYVDGGTLPRLRNESGERLYNLVRSMGKCRHDPMGFDNDPSFPNRFIETDFLKRLYKGLEFRRNKGNDKMEPRFELTMKQKGGKLDKFRDVLGTVQETTRDELKRTTVVVPHNVPPIKITTSFRDDARQGSDLTPDGETTRSKTRKHNRKIHKGPHEGYTDAGGPPYAARINSLRPIPIYPTRANIGVTPGTSTHPNATTGHDTTGTGATDPVTEQQKRLQDSMEAMQNFVAHMGKSESITKTKLIQRNKWTSNIKWNGARGLAWVNFCTDLEGWAFQAGLPHLINQSFREQYMNLGWIGVKHLTNDSLEQFVADQTTFYGVLVSSCGSVAEVRPLIAIHKESKFALTHSASIFPDGIALYTELKRRLENEGHTKAEIMSLEAKLENMVFSDKFAGGGKVFAEQYATHVSNIISLDPDNKYTPAYTDKLRIDRLTMKFANDPIAHNWL